MRTVKVGIIGCGGIANHKHMPSLKQVGGVQMVAFCDIIIERAQKAARDFGTPDARTYEDYRELLKDPEIEIVHVLTPNRSHADITVDALHAGKHVMCEKPMAKTAADARRMCEAAKETGKVVTVEEHSVIGGLGSAVCDVLSEKAPTKVLKIGMNDMFGESGPAKVLLAKYELDANGIYNKIKAWL